MRGGSDRMKGEPREVTTISRLITFSPGDDNRVSVLRSRIQSVSLWENDSTLTSVT